MSESPVPFDPWPALRAHTSARIGLGRAGDGLPTKDTLELQLAHARARDAVHESVDFPALAASLSPLETVFVLSAASDRATYLRRPDLGRTLAEGQSLPSSPCDVAFVIGDGLSSAAIQKHACAVVNACLANLPDRTLGPIVLAKNARVALSDEIGFLLGARLIVMLIGERPGLSSPDSLGIYLTWAPKPGRIDAERNCISNIHANGMSYEQAAEAVRKIVDAAFTHQATGVALALDLAKMAILG